MVCYVRRHAVPLAWAWALGLHVLSWIAQVYLGHTLAEKRKPALLDSFVQVCTIFADKQPDALRALAKCHAIKRMCQPDPPLFPPFFSAFRTC